MAVELHCLPDMFKLLCASLILWSTRARAASVEGPLRWPCAPVWASTSYPHQSHGSDMSHIPYGLPDVSERAHSEPTSPTKAGEGTSDDEVLIEDEGLTCQSTTICASWVTMCSTFCTCVSHPIVPVGGQRQPWRGPIRRCHLNRANGNSMVAPGRFCPSHQWQVNLVSLDTNP